MPTLIQDDGHPILPGPGQIATDKLRERIRQYAHDDREALPWRMWCGTEGALENAYAAVRADDAGTLNPVDVRGFFDAIIYNLIDTQIRLAVLTHPADCANPECEIVIALGPDRSATHA
jgi:hypothetical protein